MYRDLCGKMKNMDLMAEAKEESAMELDNFANAPLPQAGGAEETPASSFTIAAMIDQRVRDTLKPIKSLLSTPSPLKREQSKVSSFPPRRWLGSSKILMPPPEKKLPPRGKGTHNAPKGKKKASLFGNAAKGGRERLPRKGLGRSERVSAPNAQSCFLQGPLNDP